jgi:hypothetical protein
MKLNQVSGIFEKLLELTLEFLSGMGWVCESLMLNFGQHAKHSKKFGIETFMMPNSSALWSHFRESSFFH